MKEPEAQTDVNTPPLVPFSGPALTANCLFFGCATEQPRVVGAFASQVAKSDVAQIERLLVTGRSLGRPTMTIEAVAVDKARVTVAGLPTFEKPPETSGRVVSTFTAIKRNGKWVTEGGVDVKRMPATKLNREPWAYCFVNTAVATALGL